MSNPIPQGKYKPAVRKGNLIFTAGMTPRLNGQLIMSGKVESGVSVEDYRQAADQATANALNAALSCVQPGEKITQDPVPHCLYQRRPRLYFPRQNRRPGFRLSL